MPVAAVDTLAPFPGLSKEAFTFLRQLKRNNDREWFRPRKDTYVEEIRDPMRALITELSRRLPERGIPLSGDPKRAVFRIYRDTRFSKNKSPYKTHVAALVSREGDKRAPGALYLHIEPKNCRVGGGFWRTGKDFITEWRAAMSEDPQAFLDVVEAVEGAGLEMETAGSSMTRMPRGYDDQRDNPATDYFRWKNGFAAMNNDVDEELVMSPDFADFVVETAEAVRPLLEYGWQIADAVAAKKQR